MSGCGMPGTEGVLQGMAVRYVDEPAALDELHEKVSEARGREV